MVQPVNVAVPKSGRRSSDDDPFVPRLETIAGPSPTIDSADFLDAECAAVVVAISLSIRVVITPCDSFEIVTCHFDRVRLLY